MILTSLVTAASMLASTILAAPPQSQAATVKWTTTSTLSAVLTFNITTTFATTIQPVPTSTSSSVLPTYSATEIYAYKPGSPVHLLSFQALGMIFRLGGQNGEFCPTFVEEGGGCSKGNTTWFNGCGLSVSVPGGQATYIAPDGQIKFTQAHSQALYPSNSQICPITFTPIDDSDTYLVGISGFGAQRFMACPMLNGARVKQQWQVYGNVPNTTFLQGFQEVNSSACIEFEALGIDKMVKHNPAAWEYV